MTEDFRNRYIAARKAVIEADFAHLNPMQREAVMTTEGPLLLLAGAGSGKTTVLINRIANILKYGRGSDSDFVPENATEAELAILEAGPSPEAQRLAAVEPAEPWRMIAITFTNKAADELKARLENMLGAAANDIWAQTFHSACVRILHRDADRLGFPNNFTIYDTGDSQSIMKRIIREKDLDDKTYPYKMVLSRISKIKDAMLTPEQYAAEAAKSADIRTRKIAELYSAYSRRLREAGAMDFDDLLYYTVRLLEENEDVRRFYQEKFKYVLIDEYQDTNNLQYRFASLLAGERKNICVVGDDDQSIYKFRGATIENILSFEEQYRGCRTIRLEQNYRSTGRILDAANAVIRNNQGRKGKNLWTEHDAGDLITVYTAQNENDEAKFVADRIMEGFGQGENWRDHAVLYRMNAQSNQLEYAFKRAGVPYRIVGGTRFFERAEIKDVLAYLTVILNPADDLRLSRVINTPARGIGERSMETAREIAAAEGRTLFDVVAHADSYPQLSRASLSMRRFAYMIRELQAQAESMPLDQLYDLMLDKTGYIRALEEKNNDENVARIENVGELKSNIVNYMKESGDETLAGFMDEVALYTDLDSYDKDADCVVMMTMHSAKGLEFDTVFIVGAEEGMFPGVRAIGEPDEMEEERRLCYVAITRARKKLYMTHARQRMLFGRTSVNKVSRFVEEIPAELIEERSARPNYDFSGHGFAAGTERSAAAASDKGRSYGTSGGTRRPEPAPKHRLSAEPAPKPAASFKAGDRVSHKAFGEGTVSKLTPMGGDNLIEIDFGSAGTKRLMLRAAAQYLSKL